MQKHKIHELATVCMLLTAQLGKTITELSRLIEDDFQENQQDLVELFNKLEHIQNEAHDAN